MKHFILLSILSLAAFSATMAQDISLIDIEKSKDAYPINDMYSRLNMYAELNGIFYFAADDGIHGSELWRSDGTAAGTTLVKDINPGIGSAFVNDIITVGGKIYFSAYDEVNGQELWSSDGTSGGTQLVADVNPGNSSSRPGYITNVNGTVYFAADYYSIRSQVWKSDGTASGTVLMYDFSGIGSYYGYNVRQLTNVNGQLFFTMESFYSDPQLFVSDGTTEGTRLVKDINPFGADFPSNLTPLNGLLYFSATDETGTHLWQSDGTDVGTHAVNNVNNINLPIEYYYEGSERPFVTKDNTLFFQAYNSLMDYELYKFNTAAPSANVALVKNIVAGSASSYPANLVNVDGTLFFTIGPVNADAQLWKTDGTAAGTKLVKNINPGGINYYYGLINVNGKLMFVYSNEALGFELWTSDGTGTGTVLVKDIMPGIYSSFPQYLSYKGGKFMFGANDGTKGFELWKSDGTSSGTVLVKNINTTASSSSYPYYLTYGGNGKTFFTAGTQKFGFELYVTNGTEQGTKLAKDLTAGSFGTYIYSLTAFDGGVAYVAYNNGYYIGKSDGTAAGTSLFFPLDTSGEYYIPVQNMAATDNLLYFTTYNYITGIDELWRSDGTSSGTYVVKGNLNNFFTSALMGVGNIMYFVNYDEAHGYELWKSDGTESGTTIVKDINPGSNSSYPSSLYNFKGKLYFSADVGYGPYLFMSDGTSSGTQLVKPYLLNYYQTFAQANNKLFFSAINVVSRGYELFATDGTKAGTAMVKDIYKGPGSSYPMLFTEGKQKMYFQAYEDVHGQELWVSDGSEAGTKLVKDIVPGIESDYYFRNPVNVNDELFFVQNEQLWQSDATPGGTHAVNDPEAMAAQNIYNMTAANDRLYFTANEPLTGYELYTGKVAGATLAEAPIAFEKQSPPANAINPAFSARLLSNPVGNELRLLCQSKQQATVHLSITDAAGKTLLTDNKTIAGGSMVVSYRADEWTSGLYFVKIEIAGSPTVILKAVK